MSTNLLPSIYVLSDSIGETGESLLKAAASQFPFERLDIRRIPYIQTTIEIDELVQEAYEAKAAIAYTLVNPALKAHTKRITENMNVLSLDIMGPTMDFLQNITELDPKNEPGLIRKLDQAYFRRVEAIEFAVRYDDGKEPRGMLKADIVLLGISRTSKTPLSMYLANRGLKVANLPLVPEVPPSPELFDVPRENLIGLTISTDRLNSIRKERLKTMGLDESSSYAQEMRIQEELEYARGLYRRLRCPVIDVSGRAIEETASKILELYKGTHTLLD
ncbi:MAG: kinase/pyrophosphorylase [Negativicutes bacterium]|nr:kinase/pyrophosphorylase [Negativicutes bacterium]